MNEQDAEINSQHSSKSNSIFGGAAANPYGEHVDSNSPMMVDDDDDDDAAAINAEPEVELMDDEDDDDDDDDEEEEEEEEEDEEAKLDDDLLNNNKKLANKNLEFGASELDQAPAAAADVSAGAVGDETMSREEYERRRFQSELEFVQSLANPSYLNFLAQRGYFRNQSLINYLKYLMYWKEPEYVKYITYPQCLSLLEMLQHETFLKEIVKADCSKYIDEQLLMLWYHYKRARDWCKTDPTQLPGNLEHLFKTPAQPDDATSSSSPPPTVKTEGQDTDSDTPSPDAFKSQFSASIDDLFSADSRISLAKY